MLPELFSGCSAEAALLAFAGALFVAATFAPVGGASRVLVTFRGLLGHCGIRSGARRVMQLLDVPFEPAFGL